LFIKTSENKEEQFPANTHLIGDSAYGLSEWLLTPYKDFGNLSNDQKRYNFIHSSSRSEWLLTPYKDFGNLSNDQKRYNFIHSSSRMCIERAFGH